MKKLFYISFLSLAIILVASCRKSVRDTDVTNDFVFEQTLAQHIINDIFLNVRHFSIEDSIIGNNTDTIYDNSLDGCIQQVYYSSKNGENAVILAYENNTSACSDGKVRSGRVVLKVMGKHTDSLATTTVTFSNYRIDSILVEGTMTISNKGIQSDGKRKFSVTFKDLLLSSDTLSIQGDFEETFYQNAGVATDSDTDDTYETTGKSTGIISNGNSFNASINEPLYITTTCEWITQGKITITPANISPRIVDYGSGSCDKKVDVTKNETTSTLEFPY